MKTSSQLLVVRIATATTTLLLAFVPFVVTLSLVSMLVLIPTIIMVVLLLGAAAEYYINYRAELRPNKAIVDKVQPARIASGIALVEQPTNKCVLL